MTSAADPGLGAAPTSPNLLWTVIRGALIYGVGDFLPKAASLLLLPLLTVYLMPSELGILAAVATYGQLLSFVLQLNLSGALLRFYTESSDVDRRQLAGTIVAASLLWGLALTALVATLGGPLLDHAFRDVRFDPYLRLGTWLYLLISLRQVPLAVLQMQQRPLLYRALTTVEFVLTTGLMLYFVVGRRAGALGSLTGQTIGQLAALVLLFGAIRRQVTLTLKTDVIWRCLRFSFPLVAYSIGAWTMDATSRVFVEHGVGVAELGVYNVAAQIALIVGFAVNAVGLAFTPIYYQTMATESGPDRIAEFGRRYWAATLALALAVALLAPDLVRLLTTPKYAAAAALVPILVVPQALIAIWQMVVHSFFLKHKTHNLAGLTLLSGAASFGLNAWLVPRWGVVGAALAQVLVHSLMTGGAVYLSRRLVRVPFEVTSMLAASGGAVALYALVGGVTGEGSSPVVLTIRIASVAAYVAALYVTGVLRGREWAKPR